jgi:hypothetical protein
VGRAGPRIRWSSPAHEGEFAGRVRELDYAGDILSLELVPSSFAKLTKAHRSDKRWRSHNIALGAEAGQWGNPPGAARAPTSDLDRDRVSL